MAQSQPSGTNTFLSVFDQKAKLIVNYSRNKKDFLVNALTDQRPVDYVRGNFLRLKPEAAGRIIANPEEVIWTDGQPRPRQQNFLQDFEYVEYFVKTRSYTVPLGYKAIAQAPWDIIEAQSAVLAQQAMSRRTKELYDLLATSSIYPTGNTDTATNVGGGFWSAATSTNRYIQRSLNKMRQQISIATFGSVKGSQLTLVISPVIADAMARSAEIADYVSQSTAAPEFLNYELWQEQTKNYGLPSTLYGYKLLVDETVSTASKPITTNAYTASYTIGNNSAFVIAGPGQLQGGVQSTTNASISMMIYRDEDMTLEVEDQPFNKLKLLHLTDSMVLQQIAPESMYLLTNILS